MQLSVVGLNHNTASVDVRECMAVEADKLEAAYRRLLADPRVSEAMILSTCNRVEYYIVTHREHEATEILYITASCIGAGAHVLRKHTYIHCARPVVSHMVMVASGIDSLVLGEPQIFGQVKEAFRNSRKHGGLGSYLNRLEQFVLKTTKKVRTETGIASSAVSVSYAAVALAKKIFGSLVGKKALIIGAGEMCELAAEHLEGADIGSITVTNRTFSKAEDLARRFHGEAVSFDSFKDVLGEMDIVISSTGAPYAVVSVDMVKNAISARRNAPMFFIDIAVPRDIDADVAKLNNVYLYDIDDLRNVVEANKKERENEAEKARELIQGAVARFEKDIAGLAADPLIVGLRKHAEDALGEALIQFCKKNKLNDEEAIQNLRQLLSLASGKLMHVPVRNLKSFFAEERKYTLAEAAALLFDIKER